MNRIFETFTKTIGTLPPKRIRKALDIQCSILEDNLPSFASRHTEDILSILGFRQYVWAFDLGEKPADVLFLPAEHVEFYRRTVMKMVQRDELPKSAMENFDRIFLSTEVNG